MGQTFFKLPGGRLKPGEEGIPMSFLQKVTAGSAWQQSIAVVGKALLTRSASLKMFDKSAWDGSIQMCTMPPSSREHACGTCNDNPTLKHISFPHVQHAAGKLLRMDLLRTSLHVAC
eukprot:1147608-Pelagomonas_calceolata.AAC.1